VRSRVAAAVLCIGLVATACASDSDEGAPKPSPRPPEGTTSPTSEPTDGTKPAIVVTQPASGDEVASPVTISGTADVFEATVHMRVLNSGGLPVAERFTTATCGSGCRGEFSTELSFFVEKTQDGTIEVFESSAEDGSPINVVTVPVVLVAG
jgi:Immunoglobulin-like domain of bacterial spore germination